MTNKPDQKSSPQKESNADKGKHDFDKNLVPEKKPNTEPENPLRKQK